VIAIVGCGKSKLGRAAPARDLYTGQLFVKSLLYAERRCERVWIASAKGGLLRLDQVLEPYDDTLTSRPAAARWGWGRLVWDQLRQQHQGEQELLLLAGALYAEPIAALARAARWTVEMPLAGLQIGERLRWLKRELGATP
jgi:hypothetical protein